MRWDQHLLRRRVAVRYAHLKAERRRALRDRDGSVRDHRLARVRRVRHRVVAGVVVAADENGLRRHLQRVLDEVFAQSPRIEHERQLERAGQLLGLNTQTGKLAWQTALSGTPFTQPIFWPAENAIVLKIGDHQIGAFDAASGKARWLYTTPEIVTSPVANDNSVTVATSAGNVVALQ